MIRICVLAVLLTLGCSVSADPGVDVRSYISDPSASVWRGHGNEPSWSVWMSKRRVRIGTDSGTRIFQTALPEPEVSGKAAVYETRLYALSDPLIRIGVAEETCRDSIGGMVYPHRVDLFIGGRSFEGCGGLPHHLLAGVIWVVWEIGGEPIVPGSRVDLVVTDRDRFGGSSGCNRYAGALHIAAEGVSIDRVASTKMACRGPLMEQEDRYLRALEQVSAFDIDDEGQLILMDSRGVAIRARPTPLRR